MLAMLLDSLPNEKIQINRAFSEKDFAQMENLVHRLYGSCCYCGVPRLKRVSGLLDKLLNAQQYTQADGALTSLNYAIDDVIDWAKDRDINTLFGLSH
jgi:two-component system sensor histidine kinase BarA